MPVQSIKAACILPACNLLMELVARLLMRKTGLNEGGATGKQRGSNCQPRGQSVHNVDLRRVAWLYSVIGDMAVTKSTRCCITRGWAGGDDAGPAVGFYSATIITVHCE